MPKFNQLIPLGLSLLSLVTSSPTPPTLKNQVNTLRLDRRSLEERDGRLFNVFEHAATGAKISYVKNSGICEKSVGVNQYSGYLDVGNGGSLFFWFFEARNNPETAPVVSWFNGGPGCASMIGLFQENGPCKFENGASVPTNNTLSWNNYANMLYIDQPFGTGFSPQSTQNGVSSTVTAAPYVWQLLQAFYKAFPQYTNRDFGIFGESYGGHYLSEFADYIEQQNDLIVTNKLPGGGTELNLVAVGINNAWIDAEIQHKAYVDYSYNNTYKPMISASQYRSFSAAYERQCKPALQVCTSSSNDVSTTSSNNACARADRACQNAIQGPLSQARSQGGAASYDFDVYDIRQPSDSPFPPKTYASYLAQASVRQAIGATRDAYTECSDPVYAAFSATGDNSRSFLPDLARIVNRGIRTLIWAGDSDWICNWFGNRDVADALVYPGQARFKAQSLKPYTVAGKHGGDWKEVGNFAFMRVFGAGHEVPYYTPELALQVMIQLMKGGSSTTGLAST